MGSVFYWHYVFKASVVGNGKLLATCVPMSYLYTATFLDVSSSWWPEAPFPSDMANRIGETVQLYCSIPPDTMSSNSKLQWLDGDLPIESSTSNHRELATNGRCNLTLTIHNFTIWDYGTYRCRCVNNYTLDEVEDSKEPQNQIPLFCSQPSEEIDILPGTS